MWTEITRPQYDRTNRRYASDPRSQPGAGFERCRMEPDRTLHAATQAPGAAPNDCLARHRQRHPVHAAQRMPLAVVAQGLPATLDGTTLFRLLA